MSTINVNQLPGQGARRTASPRTPILSDEQLFPGGLIIDGTLSRDTGNTGDLDVLRAGNIMGRITASKKFRPSIIGLTTVLHDTSAVTVTMTLPAEIVSSPLRLHISVILMMDRMSSFIHIFPNAPMVSYSGLCTSDTGYFPSLTSNIPPHAIGHMAQAYFLVWY